MHLALGCIKFLWTWNRSILVHVLNAHSIVAHESWPRMSAEKFSGPGLYFMLYENCKSFIFYSSGILSIEHKRYTPLISYNGEWLSQKVSLFSYWFDNTVNLILNNVVSSLGFVQSPWKDYNWPIFLAQHCCNSIVTCIHFQLKRLFKINRGQSHFANFFFNLMNSISHLFRNRENFNPCKSSDYPFGILCKKSKEPKSLCSSLWLLDMHRFFRDANLSGSGCNSPPEMV